VKPKFSGRPFRQQAKPLNRNHFVRGAGGGTLGMRELSKAQCVEIVQDR
jgi:hypothetical protein